ncbi:MAG: hypothetical protein LUC50_03050 [Ruminococcus sp.]|nr:hypothetical protein [Ruminococcus sp.]
MQLLRRAEERASEIEQAAKSQARRQYADDMERAKSAGQIRAKYLILEEKQRLITETLSLVQEHLASLDDAAYFAYLQRLLACRKPPVPGELLFFAADRARIPQRFRQAVKKAGCTIAEKMVPIDGGFLLRFGEVQENCTFGALLTVRQDRLQDVIRRVLLQEEVA